VGNYASHKSTFGGLHKHQERYLQFFARGGNKSIKKTLKLNKIEFEQPLEKK